MSRKITRFKADKNGLEKNKIVTTVLNAKARLKTKPPASITKSDFTLSIPNIKTLLKSEIGPVIKIITKNDEIQKTQ